MTLFRKKKPLVPSLDDIVFEHRNKEYGCYEIRSTYSRRLQYSFYSVLAFFIVVTLVIYFWKINPLIESNDAEENLAFQSVEYNHDILPLFRQLALERARNAVISDKEPLPDNSRNPDPKSNVQYKAPIPEYKPVITVVDTSRKKIAEELLQRHKNNLQNALSVKNDSITLILEKVPQFPGGYTAIQSFFIKNQHYPESALLKGIRGSALVSFIINKQGQVENAKVVEGLDPELDREAIRLVSALPVWQPAYAKGKPVACMMVLPVDFVIR